MWELRSRAQVHTTSALLCWAACDRLAKVARALWLADRAKHWTLRAKHIRERILGEAWNDKRQAYVDVFGGRMLDAGVLLMAELGFVDPRDPRFLSTLHALEQHLCDGPHMRRYEAPDDFGVPQVAFNACSFWRIDALARVGRMDQARELFDALLALRNPAGLLSEDADIRTGELWGNLPQTYSMAGIVNCAMRLSRPWDQFV
jgi:GH15 family glucan-1,4-alpha-glucosidase